MLKSLIALEVVLILLVLGICITDLKNEPVLWLCLIMVCYESLGTLDVLFSANKFSFISVIFLVVDLFVIRKALKFYFFPDDVYCFYVLKEGFLDFTVWFLFETRNWCL